MMRSLKQYRYLLALIGFVLLTPGREARAQDEPIIPDPTTFSIEEGLNAVQANDVPANAAEFLVRRAGESGDPAYIAPLKQIVATNPTGAEGVTFNALHALWLLGEPPSYFLQNAAGHASDLVLAYYSILVMAREPDSTTLAQLETLRQETDDGVLHSALNIYRYALSTAEDYEILDSLEEKLDYLLDVVGAGFNPIIMGHTAFVDEGDSETYLQPTVVWARNRLQELGAQQPVEVEQALATVTFADIYVTDDFSPSDLARIEPEFRVYLDRTVFPDGVPPPPDDSIIPDLPGAVTIASDDASVSFSGGSFTLSGFDHTLDGTPTGSGDDAHGVFATTVAAQQSLLDALGGNQQNSVVGLDTPPDIAQGALEFDPAALVDALFALVTDTLTASHTGTLGSVEDPVVAYAPEGLVLSGNLTGIGVLVVDGVLVEQGGVEWTGLLVMRANATTPPAFEMRGTVGVTGAVLLYNETTSVASLVITGNAEVRYSREAFAMLRAALFPTP